MTILSIEAVPDGGRDIDVICSICHQCIRLVEDSEKEDDEIVGCCPFCHNKFFYKITYERWCHCEPLPMSKGGPAPTW